jgi:D-3-phosphoglycerate dehydrogenase / 2-oxoglutarate reductase
MNFNVARFDFWLDPVFDQQLSCALGAHLQVCAQADSDSANLERFREAHCYHILAARHEVPAQWHVSDALLAQLPQLLCVSTSGAGYDPVDIEACNRHGVLVLNQSGCNADSVAEHAVGLLLAVKHRLVESDSALRAGSVTTREALMGRQIRGLTMGLIGLGQIGRRTAALAKAFGLTVLAYDPYLEQAQFAAQGVQSCSFEQLLASSDIVSVHCPLTNETRNLFDQKAFSSMKPGATFVSTARGGIHNEVALYQALVSGKLAGAGLDVWAQEPPPADHPLLQLPNVVGSYHTGGVTHEARFNAASMAAEQIVQVFRGEAPPRMINPEIWPVFLKKRAALLTV